MFQKGVLQKSALRWKLSTHWHSVFRLNIVIFTRGNTCKNLDKPKIW